MEDFLPVIKTKYLEILKVKKLKMAKYSNLKSLLYYTHFEGEIYSFKEITATHTRISTFIFSEWVVEYI